MKKVAYLLLALSVGLNVGLLIVQQSDPPGPGPRRPGQLPGERPEPPRPEAAIRMHLESMTQHLDLDESQQQAIREVLERQMPVLFEMRRQSAEANRIMSAAFAETGFDPVQFEVLARQASLTSARADSLAAMMLIEEAAVLTDEQRVRYAEVAPTVHSRPRQNQPPPGRRNPR